MTRYCQYCASKIAWIEFIRGFCATISLISTIWLWALPLSLISGLLWACGGTFNKVYRRIGIPAIVTILGLIMLKKWYILLCFPMGWAILSIGDGYPDPFSGDEGSWLGQQVKKVGLSDGISGEITKWLIPILFQISLIPIFLS